MKKLILGVLALASITTFAQDSVSVIGSDIGRGDPLYDKIYGFQSIEDLQDGTKELAVVLLECKKGLRNIPHMSASYITIKTESHYSIDEIPFKECDSLFKSFQDASLDNPVVIKF